MKLTNVHRQRYASSISVLFSLLRHSSGSATRMVNPAPLELDCHIPSRRLATIRLRASNHSRNTFWRSARCIRVKWESNPQRMSGPVRLVAGDQQPATRYIDRFAPFGLLAERCGPSEPRGQPEPYTGI